MLQKKLDEAVEDRRRAKADAEALKNQSRVSATCYNALHLSGEVKTADSGKPPGTKIVHASVLLSRA